MNSRLGLISLFFVRGYAEIRQPFLRFLFHMTDDLPATEEVVEAAQRNIGIFGV